MKPLLVSVGTIDFPPFLVRVVASYVIEVKVLFTRTGFQYVHFLIVSAKFVFGTDVSVVADCPEEYKEFVEAVGTLVGLFDRLATASPMFKLYDNKLSQDFKKAQKVSLLSTIDILKV